MSLAALGLFQKNQQQHLFIQSFIMGNSSSSPANDNDQKPLATMATTVESAMGGGEHSEHSELPADLKAGSMESCKALLYHCEMFQKVGPTSINKIAKLMDYKVFKQNDVLLHQGENSTRFYLLEQGDIRRQYVDPSDGKLHSIEYAIKAKSINSMKILAGDPVYASTHCTSDECKVFEMQRDRLMRLLHQNPEIATNIAAGLCEELRKGSRKFATPLLEQQSDAVNFPAVSIAAGIESYYRSALNAMLNTRLTGVKAELFPNMHIQVPTRISYICGFKGLRSVLEERIKPDDYEYPTTVRLVSAIAPGIIMTPISSVLEASNAGHMNKESMTTRWMRGAVPRAGREIIFGVGLNQMSDYFEERCENVLGTNKVMSNAVGSLMAGVVSGYLSHVPHNMSTFKLLEPQLSYGQLYAKFVDKSVPLPVERMVQHWPSSTKTLTRYLFATLFPRGVMIRTTQIVGSFMILNGTINYLSPSFNSGGPNQR